MKEVVRKELYELKDLYEQLSKEDKKMVLGIMIGLTQKISTN